MKISRLFVMFLLACLVSFYFFPIGFTFLPASLNTKMILGVVGILAFAIKSLRERSLNMSRMVVASAVFAIVFSVWCYYSMVDNGTDDDSYASYYMSFAVWLGGAFGVISLIRRYHGYCDMRLITSYLAFVCVMQCALALYMDSNQVFRGFVDRYVNQGQEFFQEVDRLYGIGAALDPAGVRFACVLILIAHQVAVNKEVTDNKWVLAAYIVCFLVITMVGNMISRTTSAGVAMGLGYMFLYQGFAKRGVLSARQVRFYGIVLSLVAVAVALGITLYNTDAEFRHNIRFAFEAFFNFFEQGELRTASSDKLNAEMWKWPTNTHDWLVGTGLFGNFIYSTDIGYCRFTLYCGLIGLGIFASFFIYNGLVINRKFRDVSFLSLMLISMTFIVWVKVATDIFLINAILFCIDGDLDEEEDEEEGEDVDDPELSLEQS